MLSRISNGTHGFLHELSYPCYSKACIDVTCHNPDFLLTVDELQTISTLRGMSGIGMSLNKSDDSSSILSTSTTSTSKDKDIAKKM